MYTNLEEIGNHFLDHAIELVKAGRKFVLVCDNIDWEEKVHDMRSDHQNKSVHAVASTLVFNRVSSDHLPDNGPQKVLKETDVCKVVELTSEVIECRKAMYRTIIAQHLKEHFSEFKNINEYVLLKTDCPYPEEMSQNVSCDSIPCANEG